MRRMTGFMTVLALGLALTAAQAKSRKPNATLRLSGGSVAAGVGVDWASGTLTYQGKHYPVNPLEVGFVPSTGRVFMFHDKASRLPSKSVKGLSVGDGRGGGRIAAGSAVVSAAGGVLGPDYNPRDHPIIIGCGAHRFLASFRRDGPRSGSGRDGESLRAACACIRHLRVHPGTAQRRGALGSDRISVRRRSAGHRAVGAANGSCMANCPSSLRRSVHGNWGSADVRVGVAGESYRAV